MRKLFTLGRTLAPFLTIMSALIAAPLSSASHSAPLAAQSSVHRNAPPIHLHSSIKHTINSSWSGYATTGATYSSVKGTWTQPAISCATGQTAYSSYWVGIDGVSTDTVEQAGTDADCVKGAPVYYAWYEMYPRYPVNFSNPVHPGDHMSAEVSVNRLGHFVLTISDTTRGWSHRAIQTLHSAQRGSAEWIVEAPSDTNGVLPLAHFGTTHFAYCSANGVAISSNPNPDAFTMETDSGVVKARPSSLSSSGTAFSVTWKHS